MRHAEALMNEQQRASCDAQARFIEADRQRFQDTGNALFVWDAYARSRDAGLPIPDWILDYLDDAARNISAFVNPDRPQSVTDPNKEIATAFRLASSQGKPTVFKQFIDTFYDWEWAALGEKVAAYYRSGNDERSSIYLVACDLKQEQEQEILMTAARRQLRGQEVWIVPPPPSESTIRRAWKRYQKAAPDLAKRD